MHCITSCLPLLGVTSDSVHWIDWLDAQMPRWFVSNLPVWARPLWIDLALVLVASAALLGFFLLLRTLAPRVAAIAQVTTKESLVQPLFTVIVVFGLMLLFVFLFLPYMTFGEDIAMVKSQGLTVIKLLAVLLAVWTASVSISEEVDGKTALMILSKPVGRREFIIGKLVGVVIPVAILFIVLGSFFLGTISYKVVYDAREAAKELPSAAACFNEMWHIVPGLVLEFMQAIILATIAVVISTRLPMIPNLTICMTIYLLGHMVPLMLNSAAGEIAFVAFVGNLIAAIIPVLDHFDVETAIATGSVVPWSYVGWAGVYCVLYCAIALVLGLLLFEDRDLA